MKSFVVAISGASGSIYGIRLVKELIKSEAKVHLCLSNQSFSIIKTETGIDLSGITVQEIQERVWEYFNSETVNYYGNGNLAAPISSGSFKTDGMFVVPCSMKTLAGIATCTNATHHWTQSNERVMLSHCHLKALLARME